MKTESWTNLKSFDQISVYNFYSIYYQRREVKHVKCKNVKIQDYKNWKTYLWKNGKIKSVKH